MPLILTKPGNNGRRDVLIVLGPENIERMKEKDPVEFKWTDVAQSNELLGVIAISYASDAEMTQLTQLARQGKSNEAVKQVYSGWKYRPEKGDHDLPPERFS